VQHDHAVEKVEGEIEIVHHDDGKAIAAAMDQRARDIEAVTDV
jgi:hypothetical protein